MRKFEMNIPIIAVTGRSGSGKSTVCKFFSQRGYTVVDADRVAAEITDTSRECLNELAERFGSDILDEKGRLDRRKLAQKAFASQENQAILSSVTHPYIIREILRRAAQAETGGEPFVFVDGAVIVGHDFQRYCTEIIVVIGDESQQIKRLTARDGITQEEAEKRLSVQTTEKCLRKAADHIIENRQGLAQLVEQAKKILGKLERKYEKT